MKSVPADESNRGPDQAEPNDLGCLEGRDARRDRATVASATILAVRSPEHLFGVARLFREYESSLDTDLCFQGFESELASLPGRYAPPAGELLVALGSDGQAVGCVALRAVEPDGSCEMKRLYVAPQGRGLGLGKALMNAVIGEARRIGYREMRLDTLPSMLTAQSMYREAGFTPIDPYYETPVGGTVFMALDLEKTA